MTKGCTCWMPECLTKQLRIVDVKHQVKFWKKTCSWIGICMLQLMRRRCIITTLSLNSKVCSGNMPLLQAPSSSKCRHQLATLCVLFSSIYHADLLHKLLLVIKEKRQRSCPRCRYFCMAIRLLSGHMLDRLFYLNSDLKKCAIHRILLICTKWLASISKFKKTFPWTEISDRWWTQVFD